MSTTGIVFLILGGVSGSSHAIVNDKEATAPVSPSPGLALDAKGVVFRF